MILFHRETTTRPERRTALVAMELIKYTIEKPTMVRMVRAIKGQKNGKAPGGDVILVEVWKYGGANLSNRLHRWITKKIREECHVPQAWKDANIITIYKKGDRTECGNHLCISLLSAADKIFAQILLNKFSNQISPVVALETQCSFLSNRSTVDSIFCLQPQEKCIEHDRPLYIVFVDFTKAFHTVGKTGLWRLLRHYERPRKLFNHDRNWHTGMMVNIRNGGEVSDIFAITNGVKQGRVLGPTLFLSFGQQCLKRLSETWGTEYTNHAIMQTSLQLHTSERRQNPQNILVRELLFADDSALIAHSAGDIHRFVDALDNASSKFDLNINIRTTEMMFQPNSTTTMKEDINVNETTLTPVQEFTYLGSIISRDGYIEAELQKRMSKAIMSFGCIRERLWNNHNVSIKVKWRICRVYG